MGRLILFPNKQVQNISSHRLSSASGSSLLALALGQRLLVDRRDDLQPLNAVHLHQAVQLLLAYSPLHPAHLPVLVQHQPLHLFEFYRQLLAPAALAAGVQAVRRLRLLGAGVVAVEVLLVGLFVEGIEDGLVDLRLCAVVALVRCDDFMRAGDAVRLLEVRFPLGMAGMQSKRSK